MGSVRRQVIEELASAIVGLRPGRPTRVAVDGIDASGKTMVADELAAVIETEWHRTVARASIDDFRHPGHQDRSVARSYTPRSYYETSYDYATVVESTLRPLDSGAGTVVMSLWDAYDDKADRRTVDLPVDGVLVFDGIFLQRPEMAPFWDYRIWLDTDTDTALSRARKRDVDWAPSDAEIVYRYTERNFPAHELYVAETGARDRADAVIDNRDPERPILLRG